MRILGAALIGLALAAPAEAKERAAFVDTRTAEAAVPPDVQRARAALLRELGQQAFLSVDRHTGAVRFLGRTDGYLSAPSAARPEQVARRWVRARRGVLGLRAADLRSFALASSYRAPNGVTRLIFRQRFRGIPAIDSSLRVNVTRDGRVLNVGGSPRPALRVASVVPALGPEAAFRAAARGVGAAAVPALERLSGPRGVRRTTAFRGRHSARLSLLSMSPRDVRLVWRVWFEESSTAVWDVVLDARSGRVLRRVNLVKSADGRAWDFYPGAPGGGAARDVDFGQWRTEAERLRGNNAHVYNDADNTEDCAVVTCDNDNVDPTQESMGDFVTPNEEIRPDGEGHWSYEYTPVPSPAGNCPTAGCAWNHLVNGSWLLNRDQDGTQVYFFVNAFHDFLAAPPISFGEAAGNFQFENTSGQGKGNDGVFASAMDAAAVVAGRPIPTVNSDNANMLTRPEGRAPRMQMYLFEPLPEGTGVIDDYPFSDVSGGSDGTVVYHEYTHGLSNRLITDADGIGAVHSVQSGAMGEGWSDFYAMEFMMKQGFLTDTAAPGEVKVGEFVDGGNNLIRSEPIDCTIGAPLEACPRKRSPLASEGGGGYTYEDFGRISPVGPQVHADGEIWSQTLMDLRRRLAADLGAAEAAVRIEYLVTRGMELSVDEPSYLDMRNAILQGDLVAGGRDVRRIWEAFAARGMGASASAVDGEDPAPVAAFDLPKNLPPVDLAAPLVRFDSPREGAVVRGEAASFSGVATDDAGVRSLTVNGIAATLTGSRWTVKLVLPRGPQVVTVQARDGEGRQASASRRVVSDLAKPKLRVKRRGKRVKGRVSDDVGIRSVRVGGKRVKVRKGRFSARMRKRKVRVVVRDRAGRRVARTVRR